MLFENKELRNECIRSIASYYANFAGATLRSAAKEFGVSKSTIYKMFKNELPLIDSVLNKKVITVTSNNIEQRAVRGNTAMLKNRNYYVHDNKKGEICNGYAEERKIQKRKYQNEVVNNF